jgi:hypothetical protein
LVEFSLQGSHGDFIYFLFREEKKAAAEFEEKPSGGSPKEETMIGV